MRYREHLKQRYRVMLGYTGGIFVLIGLTILSPLALIPFYPDELPYAGAFVVVGVPMVVVGLILRKVFTTTESSSPTTQEGMVVVVISWLLATLVGALPLMIAGDLTFTQAFFESTSGWTTTGLSVVDVTAAPHVVLFYRSALQLVGGAGFVIIVLSAIAGPTGSGLSAAEGRDDRLAPHVRQSAEIVVNLYITYAAVGVIALIAAGMDVFDALNHAFAALSTGGFSTRAASIGYYDSTLIEAVIIVLMLLGTINYLTAYILLRGRLKAVSHNGEIRLMSVLLPLAFVLLFVGVTASTYPTVGKQIRVAIFEAASAISTTGFSTVDYREWGDFGWMILIILMFIGGGSGSTAGGIKQFRIYVLLLALWWEFRRAFLPEHAVNQAVIWRGDERSILTDFQIRKIALFVFLYMSVFFIGAAVIVAHGYSLKEGLFEFASAVGTVGLSIGVTSPDAPSGVLWTQSFGMLLGRLEFFALVIGALKLFRDSRSILIRPHAAA